ncbi:hypothetical protein [Neomesorhizobium albiziae]|nr:hypothetical protein [Mesorhizobium albiziae]
MSQQPRVTLVAAKTSLVLVDYYTTEGIFIARLGSSNIDPGAVVEEGDRMIFNGNKLNLSALPPSTPIGQILAEQRLMDDVAYAAVTLVDEKWGIVLKGTLYFHDGQGRYRPHFKFEGLGQPAIDEEA